MLDLEIKRYGSGQLRFVRVGLYGFGNRRKRGILIGGLAKEEILQAAVLLRKVIGSMRAQVSVDGKQEVSAQARNLCEGFVFLFMGVLWCERY